MAWFKNRPPGLNSSQMAVGVVRQRLSPDVLGHSDGADRVEGLVSDVAKVLYPKINQVAHTREASLFGGVALLGLGERDADDPRAVVASRVNAHGTPATADVEQTVTRVEG